jgi:hypothetical protein
MEITDAIVGVEEIARGSGVRALGRLRRTYGGRIWRKMKGRTRVRLDRGTVRSAEVHWYEAHGIGRKEFKIKRFLP